ncbi:MAG: hypothetical protein K8S14_03845 [Actinomycetia bacterium]|nr:hypothetical protein [Actinomycetes bacterium]
MNNKTRCIENTIIDFNKKIEKFKYLISPETEKLKSLLRTCYFIIIYLFIGSAVLYIFSLIATHNPNFKNIIETGERVSILIATISILTFTYALTLEYPKKKVVVNSGKHFFKSVLNFIMSMILLIGIRKNLDNPPNTFGLPEFIIDMEIISMLISLIIGLFILLVSAYFFAKGIRDLSKSL